MPWLVVSLIAAVALFFLWRIWPTKEEMDEQELWGPKPYENHFPPD